MYRDEQVAASLQLEVLPLKLHPPELLRLLAWRRARIAAGFVGVVGVGVACLLALACHLNNTPPKVVTVVFFGTWPAALLACLATFVVCNDLRLGIPTHRRVNVDPWREASRRRGDAPGRELAERIHRLRAASLYVPLWLFCLLGPLTLHLLLVFILVSDFSSAVEFGEWTQLSMAVTWLPHLVLCLLARRFCCSLDANDLTAARKAAPHLGIAVLSVVPSALLFILLTTGDGFGCWLIVEMLFGVSIFAGAVIFLTGLAFLPAAYWWARRRHRSERELLELFSTESGEGNSR